jgi:hypothetical protein
MFLVISQLTASLTPARTVAGESDAPPVKSGLFTAALSRKHPLAYLQAPISHISFDNQICLPTESVSYHESLNTELHWRIIRTHALFSEGLCSNPDLETGYPDFFRGIHQSLHENSGIVH